MKIQNISITLESSFVSFSVNPPSRLQQPLMVSVPIDQFWLSRTLYKLNHTVYVLLCLSSFVSCNDFETYQQFTHFYCRGVYGVVSQLVCLFFAYLMHKVLKLSYLIWEKAALDSVHILLLAKDIWSVVTWGKYIQAP